jgi:hypothetical protein
MICPNCNSEFNPARKHQRFCKAKCRVSYWVNTHPKVNPFTAEEVRKLKALVAKEGL